MLLDCVSISPYPSCIAAEQVRPAWKLAAKGGPPALDIPSTEPTNILPILILGLAKGLLQPVNRHFMAGHDPPGLAIETGKKRRGGSPCIVCLTTKG